MEEQKKTPGRATIYNGQQPESIKRRQSGRRPQMPAGPSEKNVSPDNPVISLTEKEPEMVQEEALESRDLEKGAQGTAAGEKVQEQNSEEKIQELRNPKAEKRQRKRPDGEDERAEELRQKREAAGKNSRLRASEMAARETNAVPGKRRREQENEAKMRVLKGILGVLIVLLVAAIIWQIVLGHGIKQTGAERIAQQQKEKQEALEKLLNDTSESELSDAAGEMAQQDAEDAPDGEAEDAAAEGAEGENAADQMESSADGEAALDEGSASAQGNIAEQASLMARQYDYDSAITLLKSAEDYEANAEYQAAAAEYQKMKEACVPYPAEQVTHVFFHTLIHDPKKAFDGDEYEDGYNQFMVTEHEFNSIIQQMYDRGYVMVFLSDMAEKVTDEAGNVTYAAKDIMLPEGKIPFVLSQDDVSYYHYMDGDGYASRLIVDENGDVKNEYLEDDGSVSVGDYDMVPLIDRFVEAHPDFSYRGAKGYVALTGYEGILGYRTDEVYKTKQADRVTILQQQFFDSYPGGFDEAAFEKECEGAKKVADAMKANGWKFASHTWGHQNLHETNGISYEKFVRDTDRWETWVEPLVGETDTLIYAFGGDIRGWEPYSGDRFNYLKDAGFEYFCGVDSATYWVQIGTDYVRQSRRNIDGYRMYYNPDMLSDLFDVSQAWDPNRPASVPEIA